MTKIFITIPWFLPAFRAGGPIQSIANLVKEYNEEIEYFIYCGDVDLNGAALENITTGEWIPFNFCTKVWYSGPAAISNDLVKQVEAIKPDYLYIIGLFSWHFNMVPLLFCKGVRKLVSARGMLHPGALSQKKWKKKLYLAAFKLLEFPHKIAFHATDEEEKNYIKKKLGDCSVVYVAGNFPNNIGWLQGLKKIHGYLNLISIALVSPMKNILLVLKALESVTGFVQYDIYGPVKDASYWDECKEQIQKLPPNITVVKHKEIEPSMVKNVLANSHLFILPSKSENFGHAIYESLSAGIPVITSHNTPWNNLQQSNAGINVSLGNDEIKTAIQHFVDMDEEMLLRWRQSTILYAAKVVNMDRLKNEYKIMFSL